MYGATGLATTFVNKSSEQGSLIDLKKVLVECSQPVPPFLDVLRDADREKIGCNYCGSDEHNVKNCLMYEWQKLKALAGAELDK